MDTTFQQSKFLFGNMPEANMYLPENHKLYKYTVGRSFYKLAVLFANLRAVLNMVLISKRFWQNKCFLP